MFSTYFFFYSFLPNGWLICKRFTGNCRISEFLIIKFFVFKTISNSRNLGNHSRFKREKDEVTTHSLREGRMQLAYQVKRTNGWGFSGSLVPDSGAGGSIWWNDSRRDGKEGGGGRGRRLYPPLFAPSLLTPFLSDPSLPLSTSSTIISNRQQLSALFSTWRLASCKPSIRD